MTPKKKIKILESLVDCQDSLLVCYRIGKRPAGWILDTIRKRKEQLIDTDTSDDEVERHSSEETEQ